MAMAYMYILNIVKRVTLYGNVLIHLKHLYFRIKNIPNAPVANILLHEISHYYKISYIAFLQGVNLPHPPLKIQGSAGKFRHCSLR